MSDFTPEERRQVADALREYSKGKLGKEVAFE